MGDLAVVKQEIIYGAAQDLDGLSLSFTMGWFGGLALVITNAASATRSKSM